MHAQDPTEDKWLREQISVVYCCLDAGFTQRMYLM